MRVLGCWTAGIVVACALGVVPGCGGEMGSSPNGGTAPMSPDTRHAASYGWEALDRLRLAVEAARARGAELRRNAETQSLELRQDETDHQSYDDAARSLGEAARAARAEGPQTTVLHEGRTLTQAEARARTIELGKQAAELERRIASRRGRVDRTMGAAESVERASESLAQQLAALERGLEDVRSGAGSVDAGEASREVGAQLDEAERLEADLEDVLASAQALDEAEHDDAEASGEVSEEEILERYWR